MWTVKHIIQLEQPCACLCMFRGRSHKANEVSSGDGQLRMDIFVIENQFKWDLHQNPHAAAAGAAAAAVAAPVNEASEASHFVKAITGVDFHLMSAPTGKNTNLKLSHRMVQNLIVKWVISRWSWHLTAAFIKSEVKRINLFGPMCITWRWKCTVWPRFQIGFNPGNFPGGFVWGRIWVSAHLSSAQLQTQHDRLSMYLHEPKHICTPVRGQRVRDLLFQAEKWQ